VLSVLSVELNESGAEVRTGRLPTVIGDRDFLVLLFQNLLQNAIKYAWERVTPEVAVAARRQPDGSAVVSVSDNGIGFDQNQAERLLAPFYRLKASRTEGSGLGLSTCRTIAERHGWVITAEGVPDEGASFQVSIPAQDVRLPARS